MVRSRRPRHLSRGYVDGFDGGAAITGWAIDSVQPGQRARVRAEVNGRVVGEGIADIFRPDLAAAGIGDGRHGFRIALDVAEFGDSGAPIDVRLADGTALGNSPVVSPTNQHRRTPQSGDHQLPVGVRGYLESLSGIKQARASESEVAARLDELNTRLGADAAVALLYVVYLNRAPDEFGLESKSTALNTGQVSMEDLVHEVMASDEVGLALSLEFRDPTQLLEGLLSAIGRSRAQGFEESTCST